jgi:hypothetical protein
MTQAETLCVDDDNTTGTEEGTSQYPYNTLQEAIVAVASNEDTVNVAAGTYAENIRVEDNTIQILGGYVGGTAADYAGGTGGNFTDRDPTEYTSHIQGDGTDAVVTLINPGAGTLDGFRITGGTGSTIDLPYEYKGGGIYCYGGSQTISNNIIEGNDTRHDNVDNFGGGIFAEKPWDQESDISILDNTIRNNYSGRGAGIDIRGGSVVVQGNTVQENIAISDHGGGLSVASPAAVISQNLILENEVGRDLGYGWGGGIIAYDPETSATLSYNIVTGNYAPTGGSGEFIDEGAEAVLDHELIYKNVCDTETSFGVGVYVDGGEGIGSKATMTHCTIADHPCPDTQGGNGLFVEGLSEVTVINSIFWGNSGDDFLVDSTSTLSVTYTNSEETIAGTGNISSDPLFADASNNDYYLRSTTGRWDPSANGGIGGWVVDTDHSPCIDAGDPSSDYSNEPAPNGDQVNMGVYGNTAEASKSVLGGISETGSQSQTPRGFKLYQNYPNPFNPSTIIHYELPLRQEVKITIYNTQGQQIRLLVDGYQNEGFHAVSWDGKDQRGQHVASGVYFYQIQAGQFVQTKKLILMK